MKLLTGVMLIIIGAMIPSAIILPQRDLSLSVVPLQSTWQIHGLLLSSILFGPQIGLICAITYIFIGLFYLPIFHGGGSVGYILTPDFGFLLGFIPAAFTCGFLSKSRPRVCLLDITVYTVISLLILHIIGIIYLAIGKLTGLWSESLFDLILINSISPFPSQLLLCLAISHFSLYIKKLLIIK
tara:strand:+ start:5584 stop:6135 length:552 start_codon:yes stop_codon:yes gene_type:complete